MLKFDDISVELLFVCFVNYVENNCAKLDTFLFCASVSEKMIGKKSWGCHCKRTLQRYTVAEHNYILQSMHMIFHDKSMLRQVNRQSKVAYKIIDEVKYNDRAKTFSWKIHQRMFFYFICVAAFVCINWKYWYNLISMQSIQIQ